MGQVSRSKQVLNKSKKIKQDILSRPTQLDHLVNLPIFTQALQALNVEYRERIFSPLWTLWIFLSQILNPDQSCQKAIADFNAIRIASDSPACSMATGAYCQARKRLPEELFPRLCRQSSLALADVELDKWKWHSRDIKLICRISAICASRFPGLVPLLRA